MSFYLSTHFLTEWMVLKCRDHIDYIHSGPSILRPPMKLKLWSHMADYSHEIPVTDVIDQQYKESAVQGLKSSGLIIKAVLK